MLEQQEYSYKKKKNFEDAALYKEEIESMPMPHALGWSVASHGFVTLLFILTPIILLLLGINLDLFNKIKPKPRDIEFVLVTQPEQEPINKKTPLRAEHNTRAGGIHDPNKKIAPPQPALPKSAPSQAQNSKPQKQVAKPMAQKQPQKQIQKQVQQEPIKKQQTTNKPAPPRPMAKPSIPPTRQTAMKLPIPPTRGPQRISTAPTGPVSTRPGGKSSTAGKGSPKPVIASGGYGNSSRMPSRTGGGTGSRYAPGGGNAGNPGPGNPHGRPGVDAVKEPNFGPYMSELSRRIKSNWDPPRGDESKRVVLLFTIAKDGRLLNVKVVKSSGTPPADKAALAAVELTAPFRPLPSEFRGSSIDIQFTFDYNVFGVNKY